MVLLSYYFAGCICTSTRRRRAHRAEWALVGSSAAYGFAVLGFVLWTLKGSERGPLHGLFFAFVFIIAIAIFVLTLLQMWRPPDSRTDDAKGIVPGGEGVEEHAGPDAAPSGARRPRQEA